MNWTEGTLNRHSRRKAWDEKATRQKKYSAKDRARQQKPSIARSLQTVPFVPSYIPQAATRTSRNASTSSRQTNTGPAPTSSSNQIIQVSRDSATVPSSDTWQPPKGALMKRSRDSHGGTEEALWDQQPNLDAKRRRLLEKSNWTGIELQKPLLVDFSNHNSCNVWNRPPDPCDNGGAGNQQSHLVRMQSPAHHNGRSHRHQLGRGQTDPMRLRVGSQSLRWSGDGNSIGNTDGTSQHQPSFPGYESQQDSLCSPRDTSSAASYQPFLSRRPSVQKQWALLDENNHWRPCASRQQKTRPRKEPGPLASVEDPQYVIQSTPKLRHPRPSRKDTPRVLGFISPEPDIARSMVAEVNNSDASSGHGRHGYHLRPWLDIGNELVEHNGSRDRRENLTDVRSLMPGISQAFCASSVLSRSEHERHPQDEARPPLGNASYPLFNHVGVDRALENDDALKTLKLSQPRRENGHGLPREPVVDPTAGDMDNGGNGPSVLGVGGPGVRDRMRPWNDTLPRAKDLMDLLAQEGTPPNEVQHDCTGHPDVASDVDEDEVWKKSVFGDDGNVLNYRALDEAQEKTKQELLLSSAPTASTIAEAHSRTTTHARDAFDDKRYMLRPSQTTHADYYM